MPKRTFTTIDGNEAVAHVAYRTNEVIAIYPITLSSPIGESADAWSSAGKPNIRGTFPSVVELLSEGVAAGAVHGALQTVPLTTTFTSSQGVLLMISRFTSIASARLPRRLRPRSAVMASNQVLRELPQVVKNSCRRVRVRRRDLLDIQSEPEDRLLEALRR
jgi:Pyruvate flavodoxin/ferredoxin oxidoreductase, thiamine diP-bdg